MLESFQRAIITVRDDLIFTPRQSGGKMGYVVEDPVNSKFFRIGLPEYTFISLLDGRTSIQEALRISGTSLGDAAFSEQDALAICKWLIDAGLAHTQESARADRLIDRADKIEGGLYQSRLNPLFIKIPLFNPDSLIERLHPWIGWIHSLPFLLIWPLVCLSGLYAVCSDWSRFAAASVGVFAPGNWLWLGVAWLLLKVFHELSHGLACKRYGGHVRETGVVLILFAPVAYVDVTSCWRFRSKWHRIHTSAAGMFIEFFIAAVAAWIWSHTETGVINHISYNVILMASLSTLLFNANPLMRFDGYYILTDLLDILNLYGSGQQFLVYLVRKVVLGLPAKLPPWSGAKGIFIRIYGIASLWWRIVVCTGLTITAATLFHGAGIVLAAMAVMLWLGLPAIRFIKFLLLGNELEKPSLPRFLCTLSLGASLAGALLLGVSWPGTTRCPAIVEYAPLSVVRANTAGFVQEIRVRGGQLVCQGEVLAILRNDELEVDLQQLELSIRQSELNSRIKHQNREMAAYQVELENIEALKKRRRELQRQTEGLTVHAPASGRVIGRHLDSLVGSYLAEGREIFAIGREEKKELQISIAQEDVDLYAENIGEVVQVQIPGQKAFESSLTKVEPQASLVPPHPAFGASLGGPLAVEVKQSGSNSSVNSDDAYQLLEPRFVGIVELPAGHSAFLKAGQFGAVQLRSKHQTVGAHFYTFLRRWLSQLIQRRIRSSTNS